MQKPRGRAVLTKDPAVINRINSLELEIETWRTRALAAESAIQGDDWDVALPPLTLMQTRMMRVVARGSFTRQRIAKLLGTTGANVSTQLCLARGKLPEPIQPKPNNKNGGHYFSAYRVEHLEALRAFLNGVPADKAEAYVEDVFEDDTPQFELTQEGYAAIYGGDGHGD